MKLVDLFFIFVTIFTLALAVFLSNRWVPRDALLVPRDNDIPKFSVDVHFEPYPSTVNIENRYDCNATSLRVCDINDNTTLFGCKELAVRCRHFATDTKYLSNGEERVIPKNAKPNEGYALAITTLSEACNPYHGDLVLVAANRESTEYMLICSCKNPGYIGNETLLGNCSSVFVCDGKIDNIDQPLEKINCVCESKYVGKRAGIVPFCDLMTVKDANERHNDWTNLVDTGDRATLPIGKFNSTIRDNLKVSRLLNPCVHSLLDMNEVVPGGGYQAYKNFCTYHNEGIPVRTGVLNASQSSSAVADAILPSGRYEYVRFTDNVAGRRKLAALKTTSLKFHPKRSRDSGLVRLPDGIAIGATGECQLSLDFESTFAAPSCTGKWPSYSCEVTPTFSRYQSGMPMPRARECPSEFLWGREWWTNAEHLTEKTVMPMSTGLEIKQVELAKAPKGNFYGVAYKNKSVSNGDGIVTGFLRLDSDSDYSVHKNSIV